MSNGCMDGKRKAFYMRLNDLRKTMVDCGAENNTSTVPSSSPGGGVGPKSFFGLLAVRYRAQYYILSYQVFTK